MLLSPKDLGVPPRARVFCERSNRAFGALPYYAFDATSIGVVSSEIPGPMLELK